MAFTREQVEEFIEALLQDADLRERVRGAILADDFQALPGLVRANTEAIERLTAQTRANTEAIAAVTAQTRANTDAVSNLVDDRESMTKSVATLADESGKTRIAILDLHTLNQKTGKRVDDLAGKLGNLEGSEFEERFIRNVRAHIGPRFRRLRPLDVYSDDVVAKALASHPLSDRDLKDIATADLIVWSFDTEASAERALVIEVSRTVDTSDVERAHQRATLLASTGVDAVPVVAGLALAQDAGSRADALSVVTLVQQADSAA